MLHTWEGKATAGCLLCTALLAPSLRGHGQERQRLRQAEQVVQREVVAVQTELTALRAHPVHRLRPVAQAVQEITDVVAALHRDGVDLTLTTAAPVTLTLARHAVMAVPCQLVIRSADLGLILQVVHAVERGQVVETQWRIDAHGAVLDFHSIGQQELAEGRRDP
jgi:hypothetical protein